MKIWGYLRVCPHFSLTGGVMVCLGPTGRNFAAGMSGGVAYVLDADGSFADHCNQAMVELEPIAAEDAAGRIATDHVL